MSHALLSPSSASRWINCTPSARLEEKFPDSTSVFAEEGTCAHSLGEWLIADKLGWHDKAADRIKARKKLAEITKSEYYTEAMHSYMDDYATYVVEQFTAAKVKTPDALIKLEQKLILTKFIREGYGTGDVVIIADGVLNIIDLKYGKGVPVTAVDNTQLRIYGLGALLANDDLYDIQTIHMTIYQPRLDSITTDEISVKDLLFWANNTLLPAAEKAWGGFGDYKPGKWCGFCKAKAQCRAYSDMALQLVAHDFKEPELLTEEEIEDIMLRLPEIIKWAESIKAYAFNKALAGHKWNNLKLVEGKSNRVITDELKVSEVLKAEGFTEDQLFKKSLLGITTLEKTIGKKIFNGLVGEYILKPKGSPTLVSRDDKRDEYSLDTAATDFAVVEDFPE